MNLERGIVVITETEVIVTMFIAGIFGGFIGAGVAIALYLRVRGQIGSG